MNCRDRNERTLRDGLGGILMRAAGLGAERVHGTMDNTDAYRVMYGVLFERDLP